MTKSLTFIAIKNKHYYSMLPTLFLLLLPQYVLAGESFSENILDTITDQGSKTATTYVRNNNQFTIECRDMLSHLLPDEIQPTTGDKLRVQQATQKEISEESTPHINTIYQHRLRNFLEQERNLNQFLQSDPFTNWEPSAELGVEELAIKTLEGPKTVATKNKNGFYAPLAYRKGTLNEAALILLYIFKKHNLDSTYNKPNPSEEAISLSEMEQAQKDFDLKITSIKQYGADIKAFLVLGQELRTNLLVLNKIREAYLVGALKRSDHIKFIPYKMQFKGNSLLLPESNISIIRGLADLETRITLYARRYMRIYGAAPPFVKSESWDITDDSTALSAANSTTRKSVRINRSRSRAFWAQIKLKKAALFISWGRTTNLDSRSLQQARHLAELEQIDRTLQIGIDDSNILLEKLDLDILQLQQTAQNTLAALLAIENTLKNNRIVKRQLKAFISQLPQSSSHDNPHEIEFPKISRAELQFEATHKQLAEIEDQIEENNETKQNLTLAIRELEDLHQKVDFLFNPESLNVSIEKLQLLQLQTTTTTDDPLANNGDFANSLASLLELKDLLTSHQIFPPHRYVLKLDKEVSAVGRADFDERKDEDKKKNKALYRIMLVDPLEVTLLGSLASWIDGVKNQSNKLVKFVSGLAKRPLLLTLIPIITTAGIQLPDIFVSVREALAKGNIVKAVSAIQNEYGIFSLRQALDHCKKNTGSIRVSPYSACVAWVIATHKDFQTFTDVLELSSIEANNSQFKGNPLNAFLGTKDYQKLLGFISQTYIGKEKLSDEFKIVVKKNTLPITSPLKDRMQAVHQLRINLYDAIGKVTLADLEAEKLALVYRRNLAKTNLDRFTLRLANLKKSLETEQTTLDLIQQELAELKTKKKSPNTPKKGELRKDLDILAKTKLDLEARYRDLNNIHARHETLITASENAIETYRAILVSIDKSDAKLLKEIEERKLMLGDTTTFIVTTTPTIIKAPNISLKTRGGR